MPQSLLIAQSTTKVVFLVIFLLGNILPSEVTKAQGQTSMEGIEVSRLDNDLPRPKKPIYIGYEIAVGVPVLYLKSDISKLQGLRVPFVGGKVGGIISNSRGKLKGYAGLYYSDCSVANDFDLLEGGMSANLYLLRMKQIKYHTVEPYLIADFSYNVIKYYGCYLPQNNSDIIVPNNAPYLGKTSSTQARFGVGFEYQMENTRNKFIHLFVESGVGTSISTTASNKSLANTSPLNQIWVSAGLNFGLIK